MEKYYLGVDVGGTSVKGGIVGEDGEIIYKTACAVKNFDALSCVENTVRDLKEYARHCNIRVCDMGIGVPCIFNQETGVVSYGNNLDFKGANLKSYFKDKFGLNVGIANDADAAALGEYRFGAGKGYKDIALVTIGTGIGGGFILNGNLLTSKTSCFGEIGHTVIKIDGKKCACGRAGCMEAYCSMPALYGQIKTAMLKNRNSLLWKSININDIDGKTFFEYLDKDETADAVFRKYLKFLCTGLLNVANIFRPEIIIIGGGVSVQEDKLIKPLSEYINVNLFARQYTAGIKVVKAEKGNDAGILGAAALLMSNDKAMQ